MLNLEPEKDALFRGTRTTVLSTVFFLIILAGAAFPVGFAVSRYMYTNVDTGVGGGGGGGGNLIMEHI